MKPMLRLALAVAAVVHLAFPAAAEDRLWILSPSASLPFTKAVAEAVARDGETPDPVIEVEHADTPVGLKQLCSSDAAARPHAVGATRRMTREELNACQANGVSAVVEIPVGLDLLVMAQSKAGAALALTSAQIFQALAKQSPDAHGEMTPNPYKRWSEIDASLPDVAIDVRMLPRVAGSRYALQELLLRKSAQSIPGIAKLWGEAHTLPKSVVAVRDDAAVIVEHETEEVIARELMAHPTAVGIFSYRFLQANLSSLRAIPIDGFEPTPENAYAGKYPGTRTLYLYLRKSDVAAVPGLDRLGVEFLSSAALGPDGYLLKMGFVPLPMDEMVKTMALAKTLPPLSREALPE